MDQIIEELQQFNLKKLIHFISVVGHVEREQLIRKLEKAIEERNAIIEEIQTKLIISERALTEAVYQVSYIIYILVGLIIFVNIYVNIILI